MTSSLLVGFFLAQTTTNGTGLLGTQISRQVLGTGVLETQSFTLLLRQNGHDAGDGLASRSDLGDLAGGSVGDLLDAEGGEFGFQVSELFEEFSIGLLAKFKSLGGLQGERERLGLEFVFLNQSKMDD